MNSLTKIVFCLTLSRQHLLSSGTYIYPGSLESVNWKEKKRLFKNSQRVGCIRPSSTERVK